MSRIMRFVSVCLVSVVAGLALPSFSSAKQYSVNYCKDASGNGVAASDWNAYLTGSGDGSTSDQCASGSGLFVDWSTSTNRPAGQVQGFGLNPVSGLSIVSLESSVTQDVSNMSGNGSGQGPGWGCHRSEGLTNCVNGSYTASFTPAAGHGGDGVGFSLACDYPGFTNPCSGSGTLRVKQIKAVFDDTAPPTGMVSGALTTARPIKGTMAVDVDGADKGSGVLRYRLLVDGNEVTKSSDFCASSNLTKMSPCPNNGVKASLSVDSTKLSLGEHEFKVIATDVAGNDATVWSEKRLISNDRIKPVRGSVSGLPSSVYRSSAVSVRLRGQDNETGVWKIRLVATDKRGKNFTIATAQPGCSALCPKTVDLSTKAVFDQLKVGSYRISVFVGDAAGNRAMFKTTKRIRVRRGGPAVPQQTATPRGINDNPRCPLPTTMFTSNIGGDQMGAECNGLANVELFGNSFVRKSSKGACVNPPRGYNKSKCIWKFAKVTTPVAGDSGQKWFCAIAGVGTNRNFSSVTYGASSAKSRKLAKDCHAWFVKKCATAFPGVKFPKMSETASRKLICENAWNGKRWKSGDRSKAPVKVPGSIYPNVGITMPMGAYMSMYNNSSDGPTPIKFAGMDSSLVVKKGADRKIPICFGMNLFSRKNGNISCLKAPPANEADNRGSYIQEPDIAREKSYMMWRGVSKDGRFVGVRLAPGFGGGNTTDPFRQLKLDVNYVDPGYDYVYVPSQVVIGDAAYSAAGTPGSSAFAANVGAAVCKVARQSGWIENPAGPDILGSPIGGVPEIAKYVKAFRGDMKICNTTNFWGATVPGPKPTS